MIPSHACQIWSDADMLHLDTGGSQIELPNTEAGLRRALQIINDREHATNKLNSLGAPSRWSLEREKKMILAKSRSRKEYSIEKQTAAQEILRKVGLI